VAELRKRGDDFWGEFEFYLSDLLVGLVMDVVLVTLLAPPALIGRPKAGERRPGMSTGGVHAMCVGWEDRMCCADVCVGGWGGVWGGGDGARVQKRHGLQGMRWQLMWPW
jgi:hypothetical protein